MRSQTYAYICTHSYHVYITKYYSKLTHASLNHSILSHQFIPKVTEGLGQLIWLKLCEQKFVDLGYQSQRLEWFCLHCRQWCNHWVRHEATGVLLQGELAPLRLRDRKPFPREGQVGRRPLGLAPAGGPSELPDVRSLWWAAGGLEGR